GLDPTGLSQHDSVLSRQRSREREAGHMAVVDEDLAQEPAATLLLAERPLERVLVQQAVAVDDLAELATGEARGGHELGIGSSELSQESLARPGDLAEFQRAHEKRRVAPPAPA